MIVSSEVVFRRLIAPDGLTTVERTFIWRIERNDGRDTRYTLVDADTGEILDDVWLDERGQVQAYEAPRQLSDTPDRNNAVGFEAVVATATRADHRVVENCRDDRALTGQRQIRPSVPES